MDKKTGEGHHSTQDGRDSAAIPERNFGVSPGSGLGCLDPKFCLHSSLIHRADNINGGYGRAPDTHFSAQEVKRKMALSANQRTDFTLQNAHLLCAVHASNSELQVVHQ